MEDMNYPTDAGRAGRLANLQAGIAVMNRVLAAAGLGGSPTHPRPAALAAGAGSVAQELSMLRKIRLEDNKENMFKGDAEIFAITTGFGADQKPFVKTLPMPFLAKAKVD
jgi:hypothetical protein